MRSVTLPLLMFCLGLAACSGDGGRRPSTCEVISPPDVMVPTEQNRQRSSSRVAAIRPPDKSRWNARSAFLPVSGKGWGFASVRSSIAPFL